METALAGWGKRISNSQIWLPKLVFENTLLNFPSFGTFGDQTLFPAELKQ